MGKGEIAHHEQFLLFPQCFQKACFPGASKGVIVREWVKGVYSHKMNLKGQLIFIHMFVLFYLFIYLFFFFF